MDREQAVKYLQSSGFSEEQIKAIEGAFTCDKCVYYRQVPGRKRGKGKMIKINWDEVDKQEIAKSVVLLDLFTKTYCRYQNDYERFNDLKFRCEECPFSKKNGDCLVKAFKNKYKPDYRDFGCMGDL